MDDANLAVVMVKEVGMVFIAYGTDEEDHEEVKIEIKEVDEMQDGDLIEVEVLEIS